MYLITKQIKTKFDFWSIKGGLCAHLSSRRFHEITFELSNVTCKNIINESLFIS